MTVAVRQTAPQAAGGKIASDADKVHCDNEDQAGTVTIEPDAGGEWQSGGSGDVSVAILDANNTRVATYTSTW
jgi:hypothetical protein